MSIEGDDDNRKPEELPEGDRGPATAVAVPPRVSTGHSMPPPPLASDELDDEDDGAVDNPPGPTIFVSDPTVEAARIEWALRARGYVVIDVPLAMLAGRVTVQRPHLILLDVDAPGALEVAARVRALPGASGVHLIYAGIAGQTFENARDAFTHEGSGFFGRPIQIEELVAKIDSLLGVVEDAAARGGESDAPPSGGARSSRRSSSPPPPSLRAPVSPVPPPRSVPAEMPQMPPSLRAPSEPPDAIDSRKGEPSRWSAKAAEARLSPDLERLLREAEARVIGPVSQRSPESVPSSSDEEVLSPEDEVEAVLPAEILASLDEPLDLDVEDDEGSNVETGGGTPAGTTGRGSTTAHAAAPMEPAVSSDNAVLTTSGGHSPNRVAPSGPGTSEAIASSDAGQITSAGGRGSHDVHTGPGRDVDDDVEREGAPPVRREISTPRPPARTPGFSPPERDREPHADALPDSVEELGHPPPLAPQTSRPPAMRAPPVGALPEAAPQTSLHNNGSPPAISREEMVPSPREEPLAAPPMTTGPIPAARAITSADDALRGLAHAVATRVTGVLRLDEAAGIRRVVLQDGDVVTAASSVEGESLLGYLTQRGDLPPDVAKKLEGRVPPFGRLAGAALVAHGHLHQDQLWDVLQAHAAWLLTRAVAIPRGRLAFEAEPPQRLRGEPPVFGGTPGPALVVEIVRRAVPPAEAIARLGGLDVRFGSGERSRLVDECGLEDADDAVLRRAVGASLRELVETRGEEAAPLMYALVALGILQTLAALRPAASAVAADVEAELSDPLRDAELDDGAVRARLVARRALVEDGDYFAILGVARGATGYEIRRAYLDLRKSLEPARVMRPSLVDLVDDLRLVLSVVDEAYDVLKDPTRRERYRRAISHEPPA